MRSTLRCPRNTQANIETVDQISCSNIESGSPSPFFISAGAGSPFYKRVLSAAGGSRLRLAEVDQAGEHCQTAIASSDRRSGTKHAHPCFRTNGAVAFYTPDNV